MITFPLLIAVIVLIVFGFIVALFSRFKKCPPDKIMVVYGTTAKNKQTQGKNVSKCIHGGATFVIPVLQGYNFLDLTPMQLDIPLRGALSAQNIRVNVPANFTVRISEEPGQMENAAINFLGLSTKVIQECAEEIIYGQLRGVIATLKIEQINSDRQMFMGKITESIETELEKVGLKLINVNIKDITDESGYIEALGKKAASEAVNQARIDVAQKERDGNIGTADAEKEQRIKVASAEAEAVSGEKEADKAKRVAIADREAEAIEGENLAEIKKAQSEANRRQAEAEANRAAVAAEKVKEAEALKEAYAAERQAEEARALKEKAAQEADIIVKAEIAKQKQVIEAEAEAEKVRREQKGIADGNYSLLEADGKGKQAVLEGIANGLKSIVDSAGGDPEAASKLMIVDKITELTRIQVEALKNIKVDKMVVWEGTGKGNGQGGNLSGAIQDFLKARPGLEDLFDSVGMKLPDFLGSKIPEEVPSVTFEDEADLKDGDPEEDDA